LDVQSQDDARALAPKPIGCGRPQGRASELAPDGGSHQCLPGHGRNGLEVVESKSATQIDRELTSLQLEAQAAQQKSVLATLLLVGMTLVVVGVFTYLFGAPSAPSIAPSANWAAAPSPGPSPSRAGRSGALATQLEWLRGRLLELAQEKNRFLRHMSHELKTPLANIREGTELLMDGAVGELQSAQREVTAILRENGMKLQRLIENLLSFSAWQAKSVGLEITEFKLRPLIKSVLENQQLTWWRNACAGCAGRGSHPGPTAARSPHPRQSAVQCHQIHAARRHDFHPCRGERDQLILDVMDSGPGIPAEERNRIFEAFYQGKTPARRSCEGHRDRSCPW
jgi:two-component system sensor histidine kinase GlrK